ncbi:translation initiation factor IF-2 N-terminal domain-containing protein, partial [Klebsiella pneumoniae]
MSKKRLHEIAKEIGKTSKEVVEQAQSLGLPVKSHASSVEENDATRIVESFSSSKTKAPTNSVQT